MTTRTRTRTDVLLIAGFCAFLFFYGMGLFGLIGADEPRYAQVAREMLDHHDWITPTLGGHAWLEKPPLYYWQAMLAYSVFGVSDVAARIPGAVDATLLVVAVYLFFRRFRRGVEVDAALITASCAGVIGYAHAASMDMALASTFSIGMLAWWAWRESGKRIYLAAFYIFMALGMLAKGPVAPFLAAAVIVAFALGARESRLVLRTFWLPGILLFCAIALPWYFAVQMRNPQFFREFILQHNLARFSSDLYHHRQPFWYYLPVTALAFVPWTVVVIAAFVESVRIWWAERESVSSDPDLELQFRVFVCCWLVVPVAFFSISQSKLPGYILPAIPAGAVLLADYLRRHLAQEDKPVPRALVVLHALVAAAPIVPVGADCLCHHTVPVASGTPHVHCASRRFRAMCRHRDDTGKPVAAADASFCNPHSRGVVGRGGLEVRSDIDRSDNFPRARWQQNSPRSRPTNSPSPSMAFPARWNTGSRFTATKRRCATRREASRPRNICWSLRRRGR